MRFDVLVVGAGPAGASAALVLARRGFSVAVVEKQRFPRRKVCGEYISATSWPLLGEMGVREPLLALAGPPVRRVGLFAADHTASAPMPAPRRGESWGRAVGRDRLDPLLLSRAASAGAVVMQPCAVVDWEARDGGAVARLRDDAGGENEIAARCLIAAQGSWERTGPTLDRIERKKGDDDLLGFKAHFHDAALEPGLMPLVLFPGGYGGLVHSDSGRVSFSCCIRRDALRRCRTRHATRSAGDAVLAHVLEHVRGVREVLGVAKREAAWLAAGPIRPGIRVRGEDTMLRIGNAAGEAHPLVAEGISMAIQSGWLLGHAMPRELTAGALAQAARDHAHLWRHHFATRVHASALFAAVTLSPLSGPGCAALLAHAPRLLTWAARWSGKAHAVRQIEQAA